MGCGESKAGDSSSLMLQRRLSFHTTYRLAEKLGQGSSSSVYVVRCDSKDCNMELAAKIVDCRASELCTVDEYKQQNLRAEVEILRSLQGDLHCVQLVDHVEEDDIGYILMERCTWSLPKACQALGDELTVPVVASCIQHMLTGLSHLHSLDIVHRDVKPSNFLVDGCLQGEHVVKLCDFGSAASLPGGRGSTSALWEVTGTIPFCSPEMLNFHGYGTRADIWSLGVSAYVLLLGQYAYMPRRFTLPRIRISIMEDSPKLTFTVAAGLNGSHLTTSMTSFLGALLERDAAKRASANKALKLEWLRSSCRLYSRPAQAKQIPACCVSLRPMIDSAAKLGAFRAHDSKDAITPLDAHVQSLQTSKGCNSRASVRCRSCRRSRCKMNSMPTAFRM